MRPNVVASVASTWVVNWLEALKTTGNVGLMVPVTAPETPGTALPNNNSESPGQMRSVLAVRVAWGKGRMVITLLAVSLQLYWESDTVSSMGKVPGFT